MISAVLAAQHDAIDASRSPLLLRSRSSFGGWTFPRAEHPAELRGSVEGGATTVTDSERGEAKWRTSAACHGQCIAASALSCACVVSHPTPFALWQTAVEGFQALFDGYRLMLAQLKPYRQLDPKMRLVFPALAGISTHCHSLKARFVLEQETAQTADTPT